MYYVYIFVYICIYIYMGFSKNSGAPKWMVKIRENHIKMNDFGWKNHLFLAQHLHIHIYMGLL